MNKWFSLGLKVIALTTIAAFGIIVVYRFSQWWTPGPPTTYLRTNLVNAQQSDTFFTGFATVALVEFDTGKRDLMPFRIILDESKSKDIRGFCYRLFVITIGYPSLRAAIENSEAAVAVQDDGIEPTTRIDEPRVLSGDIIEARQGGNANQSKCDQINLISVSRPNVERLAMLQRELVENKQWDSHVEHGRNVLTALSTSLAEKRRQIVDKRIQAMQTARGRLAQVSTQTQFIGWSGDLRQSIAHTAAVSHAATSAAESATTGIPDLDQILVTPFQMASQDPQTQDATMNVRKQKIASILDREIFDDRVRLSDAGGYLGSLKLTFSILGIFGQEKGRWFWKRDEFYIRKDLADATYGSDFALDVARTTRGFLGPKALEITLPEPQLLALDRYTAVIVAKPDSFKRQGDDTGSEIGLLLRQDLNQQLELVEPQAIRFAKAALTAQIHSMLEADIGEIRIRFSTSDSNAVNQLTDLVRLLHQDQRPDGS